MKRFLVVLLAATAAAVLTHGVGAQVGQILTIELPRGVAPHDVVLGATGSLQINNGAEVHRFSGGFGTVSNIGDRTSIGPNVSLGSVWSRGSVLVGHHAQIHGFVKSGDALMIQHDAIIDGYILEHQTIETQVVSRDATSPARFRSSVRVTGTQFLTPGAYDTVDVPPGATLVLAAGKYNLNKFLIKPGAHVIYQNRAEPAILYISNTLLYKGRFQEEATGDTAGNVLIGYSGTTPLQLSEPFLGTLIAPEASVHLTAADVPHVGAFFANDITLANGARVVHQPFPSFLIQAVEISTLEPCQNEPILLEVETRSLAGTADGVQPDVMIAGLSGVRRTVQFAGTGERFITVIAREGNIAQARTIAVQVQECNEPFARVIHHASLYRPYTVQFTVVNAGELEGTGRRFLWDFGDGVAEGSEFPFIEHSYENLLDATTPVLSFDVTLRVVRDGEPDVIALETVTLKNHYAETRGYGYVRPPVVSDVRLVRDGKRLRANFRIQNLEPAPIRFETQQLEGHYCDPDRDPELLALQDIDLVIQGHQALVREHVLQARDFGSNLCAVSLHLRGSTSDGIEVRSSVHFETPQAGFFTAPVADAEVLALLNDVAAQGVTRSFDRISGEELETLFSQGRLEFVPSLETMDTGALADGGEVGDRCNPENVPDNPGVSCQATEEWEVSPPLIRNALKGDVFIVAACGEIGQLLRVVLPRQSYSHEGIMTRNYYSLSHSTADSRRIIETIECESFPPPIPPIPPFCDNMDEEALRFAWPGAVINASVYEAFHGRPMTDPNGAVRNVSGFAARATFCDGDGEPSPPVVIRPPVGSGATVREKLHRAAEFAASSQAASHYRFFGFSQANIAFDPPDNFTGAQMRSFLAPDGTRPTVSTSFIWHALKTVPGLILEGDELEATDIRGGGMPPTGSGVVDGLYLYTEAERRAAGRHVYNSTQNRVREAQEARASGALDWWIEAWSDQADDVAAQFSNCFGFDECGDEGAQSDAWENPGEGVAVSPDDFKFWDAPHVGGEEIGVFGDAELLLYRSADYRRIYRLAPTSGSGSVGGQVVLAIDGSPVQSAQVTVAALVDGTDGFGRFSFPAVAQGTYEIRAEKLALATDLHQECPDDGSQPCINLVKVEPIAVTAGVDTTITLELEPEAAIPPPTLQVFSRRVRFLADVHIFDEETGSGFDTAQFQVEGNCEVSPIDREDTVFIPANRVPTMCAGGEVSVELQATCRLTGDDERVSVHLRTDFWEDDECRPSADDHEDSDDREFTLGPCGDPCVTESTLIHVRNEDDLEPDQSFATISIQMGNAQGSLIELPDVRPENLRRVTFGGEATIHDDGDLFDDTDEASFVLIGECLVDPFDREDAFSWNRCVGGEARLELDFSCTLGLDHQSVNVRVDSRLLEGATCQSDDLDGAVSREFLVNPCEGSCGPVPLVFRLDNEDEGGDWADVNVLIVNEQR